jgi:hypothetical protein
VEKSKFVEQIMVQPTEAYPLASAVDLSVKESPVTAVCPNATLPNKQGDRNRRYQGDALDHPKAGRQKLDPKNRINLEKTALPKGLLSKKPKIPANSTRVVLQQLGKAEKYAPSPPRKAPKSPCSRKESLDKLPKKQFDLKYAKTRWARNKLVRNET